MQYKKTSPYVLSLLLASVSTIDLQYNKLNHGNVHDIAESDVDPWVYENVAPNVEWEAYRGRPSEAPKVDKYWENSVPAKVPAEPKGLNLTKSGDAQAQASLAQQKWIRNFGEPAVHPSAYDGLGDAIRKDMNVHWAPLYKVPPGANLTDPNLRPYNYTYDKTAVVKKAPVKQPDLFIPPELDRKNQNATKLAVNTTRKSFLPPELASQSNATLSQLPVTYVRPGYENVAQKEVLHKKKDIYKVKDSNSSITAWKQREHAWTNDQHENSNEIHWVNTTKTTAANYTDGMDLQGGLTGAAATPANASANANATANATANTTADAAAANATTPANATDAAAAETTPAATTDATPAATADTTPTEASATDAAASSALVQHHKKRNAKGNTKDIAETHVDPWVYDKVAPNVEWAAYRGRPTEAPKVDRYWENSAPVNSPAELAKPKSLHQAHHHHHHHQRADPNDIYHDTSIPKGKVSSWASPSAARSMGWSSEVNPWSQGLDATPDAALPADASAYSGLLQHHGRQSGNVRDIAESHIDPWVYDKVAPNVEWAAYRGRPEQAPPVDKYWAPAASPKALTQARYYDDRIDSYNIYDDTSIPKGETERWASGAGARESGWSEDINPWTKPLAATPDAALERSASAYTGLPQQLNQQQMIRNFGEAAIGPKVWDGVSEGVREDYKPATWNSLSYRPSLPPMTIWPASSEFPPILYEDTSKKAPVEETPKKQPKLFIPAELDRKNVASTKQNETAALVAKSFAPPELKAQTQASSAVVSQGPPELTGALAQLANARSLLHQEEPAATEEAPATAAAEPAATAANPEPTAAQWKEWSNARRDPDYKFHKKHNNQHAQREENTDYSIYANDAAFKTPSVPTKLHQTQYGHRDIDMTIEPLVTQEQIEKNQTEQQGKSALALQGGIME